MTAKIERIEVGYIYLDYGYLYKYVLYTNTHEEQYTIRDGVEYKFESDGKLFIGSSEDNGGYVYYNVCCDRSSETIIEGNDLSEFWSKIKESMASINSKNSSDPLRYNCNTAVDLSLCYAGLNLPQNEGGWGHLVSAPLDNTD